MKRFYSHYTFISPDIHFKNIVIELDNKNYISNIYEFEKEIESTEFYSGWLLFINNKQNRNIDNICREINDSTLQYRKIQDIDIETIDKITDICNIYNIQSLSLKHLVL